MPILWMLLVLLAGPARAEAVSILSGGLFAPRSALVEARAEPGLGGPSLFAGRATTGLFAPMAPREGPVRLAPATGTAVERLRHLIGQAESSRAGYDAVQHGARIRPRDAPTRLTLGEIYDWIDATPGQPHAIGRYQFIPATLRRLVDATGLPEDTMFSPRVQDLLADVLLDEAGLAEMRGGRIGRRAFMHNLAQIWAGLPKANGRSFYHGYAGNKATMSWAHFDEEMARIFPG